MDLLKEIQSKFPEEKIEVEMIVGQDFKPYNVIVVNGKRASQKFDTEHFQDLTTYKFPANIDEIIVQEICNEIRKTLDEGKES